MTLPSTFSLLTRSRRCGGSRIYRSSPNVRLLCESGGAIRFGYGSPWRTPKTTAMSWGDGTTTTRSTPVRMSGLSDAVAVAVGFATTCAIRAGGTVQCWGYNGGWRDRRQHHHDRNSPTTTSNLVSAINIARIGTARSRCALTARCGPRATSRYGELGINSNLDTHSLRRTVTSILSPWQTRRAGFFGDRSRHSPSWALALRRTSSTSAH